jgi:SOS-response transcriptional repressor LexA
MTLKRYFRENNRIRLQAENREKKKEYRPIYSTNVQVLGKLAGVYREYR